MGWQEYKKRLTVKHDFGDYGCPDFWVKLRRIDSLPYGEAREEGGMTPEEMEEIRRDSMKAEQARDKMEADLASCISDWNFTDPTIQDDPDVSKEEKEKVMPLPTAGDIASLAKLPVEFIVAMMKWIEEDSEIAKRVSKQIGTSSGQR